jgi:DNA invertase Pin-like site-specific DNA recombinase
VSVKIDDVARTLNQTFNLQALLEAKNCRLECLEEKVHYSSSGDKLNFALLAAASEYEINFRKERIKAGIALKKAQNYQYQGRKPLLTPALKKEFYAKKDLPGMSMRKLALELGINRQTLASYLKRGFLHMQGPEFETKKIKEADFYLRAKQNARNFSIEKREVSSVF